MDSSRGSADRRSGVSSVSSSNFWRSSVDSGIDSINSERESVNRASSRASDYGGSISSRSTIPSWGWSAQRCFDLDNYKLASTKLKERQNAKPSILEGDFYLDSIKYGVELQQDMPELKKKEKKIQYRGRGKVKISKSTSAYALSSASDMDFTVHECEKALQDLDLALAAESVTSSSETQSLYMTAVSQAAPLQRRYSKESLYMCEQ